MTSAPPALPPACATASRSEVPDSGLSSVCGLPSVASLPGEMAATRSAGSVLRNRALKRPTSTLPNTAMPSVAPIERKNCNDELATPSIVRGTLLWTTTARIGISVPNPTPTTIMYMTTVEYEVSASIVVSNAAPATIITKPPSASSLYRPVRDMIWPESRLATTMPIVIGSSTVPLSVADAPITPCTHSGVNRITENMPTPINALIVSVTTTVRFLSKFGGSIGSAARRSAYTNALSPSTVTISSPTIGAEVH